MGVFCVVFKYFEEFSVVLFNVTDSLVGFKGKTVRILTRSKIDKIVSFPFDDFLCNAAAYT